jgi:hypothetical protein
MIRDKLHPGSVHEYECVTLVVKLNSSIALSSCAV